jgi:YHS domain-containing protein
MKLLLSVLVLAGLSWAQLASQVFVNKMNVAISGYDPVSYFVDQKPVLGDAKLKFEWMGAEWRFASQSHLDQFAKEPEKFAPQYGGFCAFGVSRGYKAKIDPQAWSIVGGKLYLNYNSDVQKTWKDRAAEFIRRGDEGWPTVKLTTKVAE